MIGYVYQKLRAIHCFTILFSGLFLKVFEESTRRVERLDRRVTQLNRFGSASEHDDIEIVSDIFDVFTTFDKSIVADAHESTLAFAGLASAELETRKIVSVIVCP